MRDYAKEDMPKEWDSKVASQKDKELEQNDREPRGFVT
jgi:hypothetical protein